MTTAVQITVGIAGAAAAHGDRCAGSSAGADNGLHFGDAAGTGDGDRDFTGVENVGGVEATVGLACQDIGGAERSVERIEQ